VRHFFAVVKGSYHVLGGQDCVAVEGDGLHALHSLSQVVMASNARVNLFPEFTGTLKRDHPSRSQHHGVTGGGITTPPFRFLFNAKFSESADQNILAGCKGSLHDFQKHLDGIGGLFLGKTVAFGYRLDYFGLC
jgi:hypothetical protein